MTAKSLKAKHLRYHYKIEGCLLPTMRKFAKQEEKHKGSNGSLKFTWSIKILDWTMLIMNNHKTFCVSNYFCLLQNCPIILAVAAGPPVDLNI